MEHLRALRILGLAPGVTADEIKDAWRDLAKVWHPDRFPHDDRLRQKATDNLAQINAAYDALGDYDPSVAPRLAARVRESVAIILGAPRGPVGIRHSLRILGLGRTRATGEVGTRHANPLRRLLGWLVRKR